MTTELEQEFYDTFGIEPEYYCTYEKVAENKLEYECTDNNLEKCKECCQVGKKYPKITDDKLLRMICIVMKYKNIYRFVNGIEDLKEQTLKILISLKDMLSIYAEIQQLFKD